MNKNYIKLTMIFLATTEILSANPRETPLNTFVNLTEHTSSFRELIIDCTERSISLSCHRAGVYYIENRKEYYTGMKYINNSCTLGRGYSCTLLGKYYEAGEIVKYNYKLARKFYNYGCLKESGEGCKLFGEIKAPPPKKRSLVPDWFYDITSDS